MSRSKLGVHAPRFDNAPLVEDYWAYFNSQAKGKDDCAVHPVIERIAPTQGSARAAVEAWRLSAHHAAPSWTQTQRSAASAALP